MVSADQLLKVIKTQTCVGQCHLNGGCPCDGDGDDDDDDEKEDTTDTTAHAAKPYSSAEIMSKETFKYGRFSAAVRPSKQYGTWTSFYLLGEENPSKGEMRDEWYGIHYRKRKRPGLFYTSGAINRSSWYE